jgi:predicted ATPase
MKTSKTRFFRVLAWLALPVFSPVVQVSAAPGDAPSVRVEMPSEGEALAKGFEQAFGQFSGGPLFLTYEKEGSGLRTLAGIRSVQAEGAVVLIKTDKGTMLAIPATRVLAITDERPSPL